MTKSQTPSLTILAIETSCDETGVAVLRQVGDSIKVLASAVASQVNIHKLTGGVVPEVAAREHVAIIQPLIKDVLSKARLTSAPPDKGGAGGITAIAVTVGPGLVPALSVGVTAAQTLSFAWQKPVIPVHHLEGHIYSALLQSAEKKQNIKFQIPNTNIFPLLALIVSGGHTMLVAMSGHLQYKVLGSTRDDAAGEAFDKVARLLGLPYPGGPALSQLAEQGNPKAFSFSRPMLHSGDFDFSFSGIKTEVLYKLRELNIGTGGTTGRIPARGNSEGTHSERSRGVGEAELDVGLERPRRDRTRGDQIKKDIAASFQQAVVETLVKKTAAAE